MNIIKIIYRKYCRYLNWIPFINCIYISGRNNQLLLNKPAIGCRIRIIGNNNEIVFLPGGGLKKCHIYIDGNNNSISIGEEVTIVAGSLYMEDDNNKLFVGKRTKICGETEMALIEGTKIVIGDDCLLSSKITFRTGDSHSICDMEGNRINPSENILIGKHVWIGRDVKILKGVSINNNCIIGTGSVVTNCFDEENVAIAGIPAKIVRNNVNWETKRA